MEHIRAANANKESSRRSSNFTGSVFGEGRLLQGEDLMMNAVLFEPGARTFWHRHEHGQLLMIKEGQGYVGVREGSVVVVSPGDLVWSPPGETHYHGATMTSFLVHDALSLGRIDWLDQVTDQEYGVSSDIPRQS